MYISKKTHLISYITQREAQHFFLTLTGNKRQDTLTVMLLVQAAHEILPQDYPGLTRSLSLSNVWQNQNPAKQPDELVNHCIYRYANTRAEIREHQARSQSKANEQKQTLQGVVISFLGMSCKDFTRKMLIEKLLKDNIFSI